MRNTKTFLLLAIAAAACATATDLGRPGIPVLGVWTYAGTRVSPNAATLSGSIAFNAQSGASISGAVDFVETDAVGQQRRVSGPFAGITVDSTTLDFEVVIGTLHRRHIGRVNGDSVTGTWVESGDGGLPVASGTFRGAKGR